MRIAMIGQKGIPTLFGGIERHVEEVSCNLAKRKDYQVFVYARPYYSPKRIKEYQKVNVVHLPSLRTKHLDAISHTFLASWHAIFKLKAEVVHYHGIGPALCVWIPKLFSPRTKVVFTFHCRDYFHQKWGGFAQFSLKLGELVGCRLADEVIPVSSEIQAYIKQKYNRQTNFIPHGVAQEKYVPAEIIKKWGLDKDNYLLVVSRLIKHKGIHYLIDAFKEIKTDKKLVIVGPSFYTQDYEQKLKKMAEQDSRIIFLGAQQGKALKELYSNAYFFINPSEQEGLPFTVLEAASFGRAMLLSDVGIHQKMFGKLPFFFKNKNVKDLKEKVEFLLGNSQLVSQTGQELKNYSRENYNWDKVVDRTILRYA